jgi:periplasmic protein TonB
MSNTETFHLGKVRFLTFASVAILHILLIMLVAFNIETVIAVPEPVAGVMKLVDVEERIPPPPERPVEPITNTIETVAETMIETDEPPPLQVVYTEPIPAPPLPVEEVEEIYLQQHMVTALAVLPESEIVRAAVYPPIALRSGIEGTVYLELLIDRNGNIRDIIILRENPPNRGFGEAAVNALKGLKAKPAEANGTTVASRLRYNYTFKIKQ